MINNIMQTKIFLRSKINTRRLIRQRRKEISLNQKIYFAQEAAKRIMLWPPIITANNIAIFLSFDEEIDTKPVISHLWNIGKKVYLPAISSKFCLNPCRLVFVRYYPDSELILNRLKIKEPKIHNKCDLISLKDLDVLIIPLVAFDNNGNRLGMGGGFYDVTLKKWKNFNFKIAGYAYDCQLVDRLIVQNWDIAMQTVITPSNIWTW